MLSIPLIGAMLWAGAAEPVPAAMVLEVPAGATAMSPEGNSRSVGAMDVLFVGESLAVKGPTRLLILADGHKETVNGTVTLAKVGASDTIGRETTTLVAANLEGLNRLARSGGGGVGGARGVKPEGVAHTPMKGETLTTTRPSFSWDHDSAAFGYTVALRSQDRNQPPSEAVIWSKKILPGSDSEITHPESMDPLKPGAEYVFEVEGHFESGSEKLLQVRFRTATKAELMEAKRLAELATSEGRDDRVMAAVNFHLMGMYEPSQNILSSLAKQSPTERGYLAWLQEYAGRADDKSEHERLGKLIEKLNSN